MQSAPTGRARPDHMARRLLLLGDVAIVQRGGIKQPVFFVGGATWILDLDAPLLPGPFLKRGAFSGHSSRERDVSSLEQFAVDSSASRYRETLGTLGSEVGGGAGPPLPHFAEALAHIAEGYRRIGDIPRALRLFGTSFSLWRRLGQRSRMCWCLWGLGSTLRVVGRYPESTYWLRQAFDIARSSGERRCALWSAAEIAEVDRIVGNRRRALAAHFDLMDEFCKLGDERGVAWAYSGIAQIYRMEGEFARAAQMFWRAEIQSVLMGDPVGVAWAHRGQSEVAKERHDLTTAEGMAARAIQGFESKGYPTGVAYAKKTLAEIQLARGDLISSHATIRSAIADFKQAGETRGYALALKTLGDVHRESEEFSEALLQYRTARSLIGEMRLRLSTSFDPTASWVALRRRFEKRRFFHGGRRPG